MTISSPVPARTVLVVDTNPRVGERWVSALAGAGHPAFRVTTAADLLARVRENAQRFDLVLLDLRIAPGRGLDLIRTLRAVPGFGAHLVVLRETVEDTALLQPLAALGVSCCTAADRHEAWQIMRLLAPFLYREADHHRTAPRAPLSVPVTCRVGHDRTDGVTLNIGTGGLAVRTSRPIPPTTETHIRFRLPDAVRQIEACARVLWVDRLLGMGLEFTRTSAADQARIDDFVQRHAPPPRQP